MLSTFDIRLSPNGSFADFVQRVPELPQAKGEAQAMTIRPNEGELLISNSTTPPPHLENKAFITPLSLSSSKQKYLYIKS
jgi:hypothetical protein